MSLSSCRGDPQWTLADGTVLSAICTVQDAAANVSAAYEVRAASKILATTYDNVFPESTSFVQTRVPGQYRIDTAVADHVNAGVGVTLQMFSNGVQIASGSGVSGTPFTVQNY